MRASRLALLGPRPCGRHVRRVAAARPRLGEHPGHARLAGGWGRRCTTVCSPRWCSSVAVVAVRVLPPDRLAPGVVALVVLVPVTLLAIPVLGRFGARADRPTLLDRDYWLGWSRARRTGGRRGRGRHSRVDASAYHGRRG